MEEFQFLSNTLATALQQVWFLVAQFIPGLIGALIILIVGLIIASGLGALVERVLGMAKVDEWLEKLGVKEYTERAGIELNLGKFLGRVVYWFVFIAFFLAVSDVLGLQRLSGFIQSDVLGFIPNVVVAVLIMLAAIILGNFLRNLVVSSVLSAKMHAAHFLGVLTWWSVIVFGFFSALIQLGVAREIILTLVTGFIAMLALAGGLAFGLGGKDLAAHLLKELQQKIEGRG